MRLIDADELTFDRLTDSICQGQAEDVVAEAPTIDAVPVVRCGECEYYIDNTCDCYSLYGDLSGDLIGVHFEPNEDHFCSYGERKADEHI